MGNCLSQIDFFKRDRAWKRGLIVFIISLALTVIVVNKRQHVYVNQMETNTMYYSSKKFVAKFVWGDYML